jgi:hypothetical protein
MAGICRHRPAAPPGRRQPGTPRVMCQAEPGRGNHDKGVAAASPYVPGQVPIADLVHRTPCTAWVPDLLAAFPRHGVRPARPAGVGRACGSQPGPPPVGARRALHRPVIGNSTRSREPVKGSLTIVWHLFRRSMRPSESVARPPERGGDLVGAPSLLGWVRAPRFAALAARPAGWQALGFGRARALRLSRMLSKMGHGGGCPLWATRSVVRRANV